ncbi:hypothetical protein GLYMA_16G152133v4 [Glycine max]|nr:hypothetical protein GLYMA_16G152133v4 [Glycine max]KAH1151523.1 hypothetical protein GYH30_045168 [Glycine max]
MVEISSIVMCIHLTLCETLTNFKNLQNGNMFPPSRYTTETCFYLVKCIRKKYKFLLYINSYTTKTYFCCENKSGKKKNSTMKTCFCCVTINVQRRCISISQMQV